VRAGPRAPVPTCPEWTVTDLIRHLAGVYAWALDAIDGGDTEHAPEFTLGPADWAEALAWWDDRFGVLTTTLAESDPDAPTWTFPGMPRSLRFWSRRQAHETAIHRLDADAALTGGTLPTLVFDTYMAADGIDEYLSVLAPSLGKRRPSEVTGKVLYHAADAGRAWEITLEAGKPPVTGPPTGSATDVGVTVAGTADAVYRAVWGRQSTAVVIGDASLLVALAAP
jgi:uncharacterized protein (TIGR03083 family)